MIFFFYQFIQNLVVINQTLKLLTPWCLIKTEKPFKGREGVLITEKCDREPISDLPLHPWRFKRLEFWLFPLPPHQPPPTPPTPIKKIFVSSYNLHIKLWYMTWKAMFREEGCIGIVLEAYSSRLEAVYWLTFFFIERECIEFIYCQYTPAV